MSVLIAQCKTPGPVVNMYLRLLALSRCGGATFDVIKRHKRAGSFAAQEEPVLLHSAQLAEQNKPVTKQNPNPESTGYLEFNPVTTNKRRRVELRAFKEGFAGVTNTMMSMMKKRRRIMAAGAVPEELQSSAPVGEQKEESLPAKEESEVLEDELNPYGAEFTKCGETSAPTSAAAAVAKAVELDNYEEFAEILRDLTAKPWTVPDYLKKDECLMQGVQR